VGADLPDEHDESDVPPDGHADRRDDHNGGGERSARPNGAEAEARSRQECYDDLRMADSIGQSARARQASADEQAAYEKWSKAKEESLWMWGEYQRKWPQSERPKVDKPDAEPGSWHGEGDKELDSSDNGKVEAECERIADLERAKISPAMREIESQDPDRHLVGLDKCLKGHDRIKEKVCDKMEEFDFSVEEAISEVSDTIRFTFQYPEARYTQGVWAEITRMENQGFEQDTRKNSWTEEQYKGINSQWIEPESGQRFEVQFHTRISLEAKELTHKAYERLRAGQPDEFEKMVLKAFQAKVTGEVPIPPGAAEIPDYP
jgi:hypothetical protein